MAIPSICSLNKAKNCNTKRRFLLVQSHSELVFASMKNVPSKTKGIRISVPSQQRMREINQKEQKRKNVIQAILTPVFSLFSCQRHLYSHLTCRFLIHTEPCFEPLPFMQMSLLLTRMNPHSYSSCFQMKNNIGQSIHRLQMPTGEILLF